MQVAVPVLTTPEGPLNQKLQQLPLDDVSEALALLEQFAALDTMQKFTLAVCARSINDQDPRNGRMPASWIRLFWALDVDNDGRLSFQEFAFGFQSMLGSSSAPEAEMLARGEELLAL